MDINEEIRFRVIDESFTDLTPTGPENASQDQPGNQEEKSPYSVTVSNAEGI
jgi:DNA-directed RNA polymerase III subunit RPC8